MKEKISYIDEFKNRARKWLLVLFSDEPIPPCLQKNIYRFSATGAILIVISIIMVFVEHNFYYNSIGFVLGLLFFACSVYITQNYKGKNYEVIECTCIEVEKGIVDGITEKISGRNVAGKKRKYIVENKDGEIIEIHQRYKDNQVREGRKMLVYVNPNTFIAGQETIYSYLGIEVCKNK